MKNNFIQNEGQNLNFYRHWDQLTQIQGSL